MSLQLWPDPRDGLDSAESPWNWLEVDCYHDGPMKTPPSVQPGWERWYFLYELPAGTRVKISADRDPQTGEWFNPHPSSEQQWP